MSAILTMKQGSDLAVMRPIEITDPHFKADPFPFYARLRAEQPVYRAKLGRQDAWLVTRYDDVLALLKDERFVKNQANIQGVKRKGEPWMPGFLKPLKRNMLDLDDPDHARLRALVQRLPNLRLAVEPEQLRWRATPMVRGLAALPVRFD